MCQIDQWLSTVEQCTANTRLKLAIAQLHSDITNLNNGLGIDEEAELYFSSGAHDAAKVCV
ncbi:hypothetical protein EON65_07205 [archaeon]|nr:MAG: hypothetical protein EON65_07205 [archaeon]